MTEQVLKRPITMRELAEAIAHTAPRQGRRYHGSPYDADPNGPEIADPEEHQRIGPGCYHRLCSTNADGERY